MKQFTYFIFYYFFTEGGGSGIGNCIQTIAKPLTSQEDFRKLEKVIYTDSPNLGYTKIIISNFKLIKTTCSIEKDNNLITLKEYSTENENPAQ